ncbi:MAG TPA: protein phosphatase 2C domain-containing protein [Nocardioides sp.]|uniref:protein phosphatase 2C domain-containing protein n=1 Tax=Nocardioides sp. TaxID=35761 RepID=UPI002E2F4454|nr:protein phosphatase 2C domain-containing protein [Nocardioides sp.]HEX3932974.1 protein phosphatase 2C domain-containing protein [Nocardioides sp.]
MRDPVSMDAVGAATWRVTSASRKGSSHGDDVPNQDAVQFLAVKDASGADVCVAAVSDGHGGRRYVRSDVGSSLAVGAAVTQVAEALREHTGAESFEALLRREVPELVRGWRASVLSHLKAHPFTDAESRRAGADLGSDPVVAYGATLLVVVVGDRGVGLAQIGDGDALVRTHGFATRPVPGDPRLVAGETTSLCLDTAVSDFRYAALPGSADPDLVLLASDGYGNSFADKDWWRAVVGDLAWFLTDHDFEDFATQFPTWLGESAQVGGDDVSAVVIARSPLAVAPARAGAVVVAPPVASDPAPEPVLAGGGARPAPATEVRQALPDLTLVNPPIPAAYEAVEPAPSAGRRARRRLALLVAALVLVVAAGIVWFATDGFGTQGGPVSPGPSQGPSPGGSKQGHPHHHQPSGKNDGKNDGSGGKNDGNGGKSKATPGKAGRAIR